jgi:hypothetical protein
VLRERCLASDVLVEIGGLPYPKLPVYVQSSIDTKSLVKLEDLIDGMNRSEEWGEQNLDLENYTDTEWLQKWIEALQADGLKKMFILESATPVPRRDIWKDCIGKNQKRLGWKHPPEIYATRYRRHGARDPRSRNRPGL